MNREEMVSALEQIYRREALEREFKLRYAATINLPVRQWSGEQLMDGIVTSLGLPIGTVLTRDQLNMSTRARLTGADLEEWDRCARQEVIHKSCMTYQLWRLDANRACKEPPPRPSDYDSWFQEEHEYWSQPEGERKPRSRLEFLQTRRRLRVERP